MTVSPVSPTENLTIQAATGQGLLVKSKSYVYDVAVANGATVNFNIPTYDDQLLRFFIGLFSSDTTAGCATQLLSSGRIMADIDDSAFSATHGPMGIYVPCAPNVQVNLQVVNKSGGSVTPVSYTLFYAVDDPNWTIGG